MSWGVYSSLLIILFAAATAGPSCMSPLDCYLQNFQIDIPDSCIAVAGTNFCLTNGLMHDFDLVGFPTSYVYPTTVDGELADFTTVFTANYQYGYMKGVLTASVVDVDVAMDTDVVKSSNSMYPIGATVTSCIVKNISITVDVTSWIIPPIIEQAVSTFISDMIEDLFCQTVVTAIDVNVTALIVNTVTPKLVQIVELVNETSSIPTMYTSSDEYVNWNETPIGAISIFKANEFFRHFISCMINSTDIYNSIVGPLVNYAVDYATQGTGVFSLSTPATGPLNLGIFNVSVSSVSVGGLDTFTTFNLIEPAAVSDGDNITLSTQICLDRLSIVVNTTVTSYLDPSYSDVYLFTMIIKDVKIDVDIAVAMKIERLHNLYVDQLLDISCILSTIDYMNITSLDVFVNITSIDITDATGSADSISGDLVTLFNTMFALGDIGYNELLTAMIAGMAQGPIRKAMNDVLSDVHKTAAGGCKVHVNYDENSEDAIAKWSDSRMMVAAANFIDSVLGTDGVNMLMTCATQGSGVASIPINYWQVDIGGLSSFYNLSLLTLFDPLSDKKYDIGSVVGLGSCGGVSCEDFYVKAEKTADHSSNPKLSFPAATTFAVSFESLFIDALTLLEFNVNRFKNLQVQQLFTHGCIVGSVDTAALQHLYLSSSRASFSFNGQEFVFTSILQKIFDQISSHLEGLNSRLDSAVSGMAAVCSNGGTVPSSGGSTGTGTSFLSSKWSDVLWAISTIFVLAAALHMRRRQYLRDKAVYDSGESSTMPSLMPHIWSSAFWRANVIDKYKWRESLICNISVSLSLRLVILLVAAGNVALFLVSNLAADAVAVQLLINSGTPQEKSATIFTFGLSQTVNDMWMSKSYFLAFLIAFLSGFWPYAKLFVMVGCLLLPTDILCVQKREGLLRFLDYYGKWSLLDIFVMVMMMCAFHLELPISSEPYLAVSVLVTPHYGFYAFLYATMLSLVLGHIVLSVHRFVEEKVSGAAVSTYEHISTSISPFDDPSPDSINSLLPSDNDRDDTADVCVSLARHPFPWSQTLLAGNTSTASLSVTLTSRGKGMIVLLLLSTAVLLVPALLVNTFEFEIRGLTALFIEGSPITAYSFYSVGVLVPEASGATGFNINFVQVSFFIFGFVFPYILLAVISTAFFMPMSHISHKRILVFLEVAAAWSALDCFLLSIVASLMQIQQFAAFIVGDSCDGINAIISTYLNTAVDGDDKCFDVVARLLPASTYLFVAVLLLTFMCVLCLRALDSLIEEKEAAARTAPLLAPLLPGVKVGAAATGDSHGSNSSGMSAVRACLRLLHAAPAFIVLRIGIATGMLRTVDTAGTIDYRRVVL